MAPKHHHQWQGINNTLANTEITNVSGDGYPAGYLAGISESGFNDKVINNDISGKGYVPTSNACIVAMTGPIDTVSSTAAKAHANSFGP
jgi:hypothetical protein